MNTGPVIRRLRKAKSLTLEQLALAAGIDTAYLSRLERGQQRLNLDLLEILAHQLGTPVSLICREAEGAAAHESLIDEKLLDGLYKLTKDDQELVMALVSAIVKRKKRYLAESAHPS